MVKREMLVRIPSFDESRLDKTGREGFCGISLAIWVSEDMISRTLSQKVFSEQDSLLYITNIGVNLFLTIWQLS